MFKLLRSENKFEKSGIFVILIVFHFFISDLAWKMTENLFRLRDSQLGLDFVSLLV